MVVDNTRIEMIAMDGRLQLVERKVIDMCVKCMYPMKPIVKAASDCCGESADTAVLRPDGMKTWRCPNHRGLVEGDETGEVFESVMVRPTD